MFGLCIVYPYTNTVSYSQCIIRSLLVRFLVHGTVNFSHFGVENKTEQVRGVLGVDYKYLVHLVRQSTDCVMHMWFMCVRYKVLVGSTVPFGVYSMYTVLLLAYRVWSTDHGEVTPGCLPITSPQNCSGLRKPCVAPRRLRVLDTTVK